MQELTAELIDQEMTRVLKTYQTLYSTGKDIHPMLFVFLRGPKGEVHIEPLPPQVCVILAMGQRKMLLMILSTMIASLKKDNIEVLAIMQAAEAWSAILEPDNTLVDAENLSDARVKIPASKHPNRKEVLTISTTAADKTLSTTWIYDIERNDKNQVTGLRKDKNSQMEQTRSIFDELFK